MSKNLAAVSPEVLLVVVLLVSSPTFGGLGGVPTPVEKEQISAFQAWLNWLGDHNYSDLVGIVGLVITVFGLCFTAWAALRARSASMQATAAVAAMKRHLAHLDTVADLSAAVEVMEEIRHHHRAGAWSFLPDRYSRLKRRLIATKGAMSSMPETDKMIVQNAIQHFTNMERQIERVLANGGSEAPDPVRLNYVVASQIDKFAELIVGLRNRIPGDGP